MTTYNSEGGSNTAAVRRNYLEEADSMLKLSKDMSKKLLEDVNNRIEGMFKAHNNYMQDNDAWREEYNELQQLRYDLTVTAELDTTAVLASQLEQQRVIVDNAYDAGEVVDGFYDIKVTINGVQHTIPFTTVIEEALTKFTSHVYPFD